MTLELEGKRIVLFDGVCNLCNRSIQQLIRLDKKNQFVYGSLQGSTATKLFETLHLPPGKFDSIVFIDNGQVFSKSTAVLRISWYLGGGWKLFYVFSLLPKFLRDPVYNLIAKNRYKWFGKKQACWLPTPELKNLFLDTTI